MCFSSIATRDGSAVTRTLRVLGGFRERSSRKRRRVGLIRRERMRPVLDCSVGTVNAEPLEHGDDLSQRQSHRMETHPEHPGAVCVRSECEGDAVLI